MNVSGRVMEAKQKRELDRLAEQERERQELLVFASLIIISPVCRKADEERDLEQQKLKRELETVRFLILGSKTRATLCYYRNGKSELTLKESWKSKAKRCRC